jgi:hypothetical protein
MVSVWDWELTDRDRRCGNKIQYDVWIDAFEVTVNHYEQDGSVLVPYLCRYCRFLHIGSQRKGENGANWRTARARLEKAHRKRAARRERRRRALEAYERASGRAVVELDGDDGVPTDRLEVAPQGG